MNAKTYESVQGIGKTAQELESFGTAQNQLNADILKELRIMQLQVNMLQFLIKLRWKILIINTELKLQ